MSDEKRTYRSILKATSLFGGVQVFNIFISLIRSKMVALLLGPSGMGLNGMLSSTTSLVSTFTSFGLSTSAVKDVADANLEGDQHYLSRIVVVVKRWMFASGSFGMVLMVFLSKGLSKLTFNNYNHTVSFLVLSITVLLSQISSCRMVVLQGTRNLKLLASANVYGNIVGLAASIPCYLFLKTEGIVPALLLTSIFTTLVSIYIESKLRIVTCAQELSETIRSGKKMFHMGIYLSLNNLMIVAVSYILRLYITRIGNISDVGLYNAGYAILNTYVGLIFTAMATDYYPRLLEAVNNKEKLTETINQQAIVSLLILAPIIQIFLVFIDVIIKILYSNEFLALGSMLHWGMLSMYFKAASWAVGFTFVPKGDAKIFLLNEVAANIYMLILSILGYKKYGLNGLGLSLLIGYFIYFFQVFFICHKRYGFSFEKKYIVLSIVQLGISCFILCVPFFVPEIVGYMFGVLFIILSSIISFKELDKRVGIIELIEGRIKLNVK